MIFGANKNIFQILREEEGDENQSPTAQEDTSGSEADTAPSAEESDAQGQEEAQEDEEDFGSEDDFNINADLSEEDTGGDNEDMSSDDSSSDTSSVDDTEGEGLEEPEANEANTDIFSSLTAEEQIIKIKELQRLFGDLYTSVDDIHKKINDIGFDEDNIEIMNRISSTIYSLKKYIGDYITDKFPYKSYIENDIAFNRFLSILNSVTSVLNDVARIKLEKIDKK